jgi:thiamine biosynthesis lipoprotein
MRHAERVMGTVVSFDVRHEPGRDWEAAAGLSSAIEVLHEADRTFSTWIADSPVSRLRRREAELADMPDDVADVAGLCVMARRMSGGWFDPWAMPGGFDPTGLVKGWAAARALEQLDRAGITGAMVNAGGDVVVSGRPAPDRPWQIAVRAPDEGSGVLCIVEVRDAIATSGTYERGAHVLDPHTGRAASGAVSASVAGPDLGIADALATALVAGGRDALERVAELEHYEALLIEDDGVTAASTAGFPYVTSGATG